MTTRAVISLFSSKCASCGHLVLGLDHKETVCHFEAGNEMCPASEMSLVVGIPVDKIAQNIVDYERQGKFDKILSINAKLSKYSDIQQIQVAKLVHAKRQEKTDEKV